MYQYRIFSRLGLLLKWAVAIPALLIFFLVGMELMRVFLIFYRKEPWMGYTYLGVLGVLASIVLLKVRSHRRAHEILGARGLKVTGRSRHASLRKNLRFLVRYVRRLAEQRLLPDEMARGMRQQSHDVLSILDHHPLNDDLLNAIARTREEIIATAHQHLDLINDQVTRSKACAVIQDLYEPPFPIVPSLVVGYHQLTLISEIADLYLPEPAWSEYMRVMRDVWSVMTKGDFLRYGQKLFIGIEDNSQGLGAAGSELAQALSVIWLTHCTSRIATRRCCTLHDWDLKDAIEEMAVGLPACLQQTQKSFLENALPVLRRRLRSQAPGGVMDTGAYVEESLASITRALETVVMSLAAAGIRPVSRSVSSEAARGPEEPEPIPDRHAENHSSGHEKTPTEHVRPRRKHHHHRKGAFERLLDFLVSRTSHHRH